MKWNMLLGSLMLGVSLCTPSFGGGLLDRMLGLRGSGCDSACCDNGCSADPSCGCEVVTCDPCKKGGLLSKLRGPSCGCEVNACDPCATAVPSCGCEVVACDPCKKGGLLSRLRGPSCGCEVNACDPCAAAAPSCGCEISDCGCGPASCDSCCQPRRKPLLELLGRVEHAKHKMLCKVRNIGKGRACCDSGCATDPSCGCEISSCDPCAAPTCGCEVNACDPCGCDTACCKPRRGLLSKLFAKKSCCDAGCDTGCSTGCSSCGSSAAPAAAPAAADAAPMPPAPVVDPSAYLNSNRRVVQATSFTR